MDSIGSGAITLELIVLLRGLTTGLLRKYFLFYFYLASVFLAEIVRFVCYQFTPNSFSTLYWYSELVLVIFSYCVVIEIFRQAFQHSAGLARLTRRLLMIVLTVAVTYASLDIFRNGFGSLPRATADLGRYLRYIEGMLLLLMLWVFARYRISMGRNVLGITLGSVFWVSVNITNLTFLALPGNGLSVPVRKLLPLAYLATLLIWCLTLWSVQTDTEQPHESEIDRDYRLLASRTRAALARTSNRLVRVVRP